MCSSDYANIGSASWHCFKCNYFTQDSSTFHSYNLSTSNRFSPLLLIPGGMCDGSSMSAPSPHMAVRHSSPCSTRHRHPSNFSNISTVTSPRSCVQDVPVKKSNNLRIAIMNVNSIRRRKAELEEFSIYAKPDLLMFTETKVDASIASSEFLPEEFIGNIRRDRTLDGGGVMIAARKDLDITGLEVCNNTSESVWAKLLIKGHSPLLVGCYYRRDADSSVEQVEELDKVLTHIDENYNKNASCTILLGGDFNVPDIDWEVPAPRHCCQHKPMCARLIELTTEHHMEQIQRQPTRLGNVLDLLFTNKPGLVKEVSILPGLSDHDTVLVDTYLHINPNHKKPRKINQWSKANWNSMKEEASSFQEEYLASAAGKPVDQRHDFLLEFLDNLIAKYVPQKVSSTRRNVPWMTRSLRRMCRKKQRLYNQACKKHAPGAWEEFRKHQRRTTAALRSTRMDYINNILVEGMVTNDNKPFWKYIKSQRQENCGVAPLKSEGQLHSDACKKAEILNDQFTSVFTNDNQDNFAHTVLEGPSIPSISDIKVSMVGVLKMLRNLNVKKAGGPDHLSCRLLKELAEELAPIYADIFQCSLDTGVLPSVWKTANVVPVYKKGPVSEAENYRPISLTCIPCKIMEHILCSHIRSHLDCHQALTPLNHGFRAKHSCDTQLLLTVQDLLEKCDTANAQVDVAVLDFSKAFDKVPHTRLMSKLRILGIDGKVCRWIKAFLDDRTQKV